MTADLNALLGSLVNVPVRSTIEIVSLFFGSETCGAARNPQLLTAVASFHRILRANAEKTRTSYHAVGIGLDSDLNRAWEYLQKCGSFDEILLGNTWRQVFFHSQASFLPAEPLAVPQMIVLQRPIKRKLDVVHAGTASELARFVGLSRIVECVQSLSLL